MIIYNRLLLAFLVLGWVGVALDPAWAQSPDGAAPDRAAPDRAATGRASRGTPSPALIARESTVGTLETMGQIIANTADSDSTRLAQARQLLLDGSTESITLAEALLDPDGDSSTCRIMCEAIAATGRAEPDRLSVRLAPPLLKLLAVDAAEINVAAARALSFFQSRAVLRQVADVAGDSEAPLAQRLAAIDTLRPNTYRRDVVALLVGLLDTTPREVVNDVIEVLAEVGETTPADDRVAWQRWWEGEALKTDADWLRDQLRDQSLKRRQADAELRTVRQQARMQREQFATRLGQALSAQYRLTPQPEREAQLLTWLESDTSASRETAIRLVAEQISEGNPPQGPLRDALREQFHDTDAQVRRMAIETIGALNNPEDAEPLLARLEIEPDPEVREVLLRVLGQLRNPVAIPTLLEALLATDDTDGCAAAAADAIGRLAARGLTDSASKALLISPLKERYAIGGSPGVRRAVLGAMAAIGDPAFKPEFQANLDSDDSAMLLEAIRGVAVVGNGAQLDRLADLTSHSDVRVRQRALAALGKLGTREQLGAVIARARIGVEPAQGPRDAAWVSFVEITRRLPASEQLAAVEYLTGMPNLAISYMENLSTAWQALQPRPAELPRLRARLAALYVKQDRHAEAIPLLQQVFTTARQDNDDDACAIGLQWLSCTLAVAKDEALPDLLASLSDCPDQMRTEAGQAVVAYAAAAAESADQDAVNVLKAVLDQASSQIDLPNRYPALATWRSTAAGDSPAAGDTSTQPSIGHQSD